MSLNFAAISPHPPIIIPGIGQKSDLIRVSNTIFGMKKLAKSFLEQEIETLIVISPHSIIYPDKMNICGMKKLFGTFAEFDLPEYILDFNNDIDLALETDTLAKKNNINTLLYDNEAEFFEMDHGLMVPLYYLSEHQESSFKVLPIAYSHLSRAEHFSFGQILAQICHEHNSRIGIVASGDLSHRLIQGAPAGYSEAGKVFDERIVKNIKNNNVQEILYYEDDFIEQAGECGYRSILILLGALSDQKVKPEILSYEGPFGVGYLVANYNLK